jgi:hypothetical protein
LVVAVLGHEQYPVFEIDMDLEPDQRFFEIGKRYSEDIINTMDSIMEQWKIPMEIAFGIFDLTGWAWKVSHGVKYGEIEGMVRGVNNTKLTMPKAMALNSFYEFGSWCTSIIVQQADGTVIHSRDLDYNFDSMRNMTYRARFTHSGNYSFDAVMFAGVIGVYTGMKENAFSIS